MSLRKKVRLQCIPCIISTIISTFQHQFYMHAYDICAYTYIALSNAVGRFKTSQYHPNSAWISWEAMREDLVIGYAVQVERPDSTREIPIRNNRSTSVRVSDLSPSTQYTFEVRAMKSKKSTSPTLPKINNNYYAHAYSI